MKNSFSKKPREILFLFILFSEVLVILGVGLKVQHELSLVPNNVADDLSRDPASSGDPGKPYNLPNESMGLKSAAIPVFKPGYEPPGGGNARDTLQWKKSPIISSLFEPTLKPGISESQEKAIKAVRLVLGPRLFLLELKAKASLDQVQKETLNRKLQFSSFQDPFSPSVLHFLRTELGLPSDHEYFRLQIEIELLESEIRSELRRIANADYKPKTIIDGSHPAVTKTGK